MQLLENPGREGAWTVSECIADGLGFGALKEVISITLIHEPCRSLSPRLFACVIREDGVLEGKERLLSELWGLSENEVDVGRFTMARVLQADCSRH